MATHKPYAYVKSARFPLSMCLSLFALFIIKCKKYNTMTILDDLFGGALLKIGLLPANHVHLATANDSDQQYTCTENLKCFLYNRPPQVHTKLNLLVLTLLFCPKNNSLDCFHYNMFALIIMYHNKTLSKIKMTLC